MTRRSPGWKGNRCNTLRLWSARPAAPMQFEEFNRGQYLDGLRRAGEGDQHLPRALSRRFDAAGQELLLKQEYFFVSASLQDLVRRHLSAYGTIATLPRAAAIQLNDTHPALWFPS